MLHTTNSTACSSTPPLTADTKMANIALRSDAHAAVLDRHRLDFCCGGQRSLAEACAEAGLEVATILRELNTAAASRLVAALPAEDWARRSLPELIDHIVGKHHTYTRDALARIGELIKKVVARHGAQRTELAWISAVFSDLSVDLGPHMAREENVLFPYVRALVAPGNSASRVLCNVRNPVQVMMMQHDRAAELLGELQEATHDFAVPDNACGTFAALYAALSELRSDLMKHISLENNVLFPRAIALEDALTRGMHDERRVDAGSLSNESERPPQ